MRTMLLSFRPDVYERIATGEKKFEHRRTFPSEPIKAYMYISGPIYGIKGILYLENRHSLSDWRKDFVYDKEAISRIDKYLEKANYALEIKKFQETSFISLETLRNDVPDFVVPQMYYYLENRPLLSYLENNLVYTNNIITHDFTVINSTHICRH